MILFLKQNMGFRWDISANGSYILASGVVVLVDADVEAYLNGTLEFNEQVNVPPTSDV